MPSIAMEIKVLPRRMVAVKFHPDASASFQNLSTSATGRPLTLVITSSACTPALGLQLRDLDPSERKALAVKSGVYVERAIGSAGSAGVHAEDVITKVNGRPVTDVDKFWKLAEASGWKFTATVQRGNTLISIAIDGT